MLIEPNMTTLSGVSDKCFRQGVNREFQQVKFPLLPPNQ